MAMNARFFVEQLRQHLVERAAVAKRAEIDARDAARTVATESEKKEDGRTALEFGSLATGQQARAREAQQQVAVLDALLGRGLPEFGRDSPIAIGAIVDVATEDADGVLERTFIVLPVGAGTELEGPGGDGFLTVVTPASPVGKALIGKRAGEVTDVVIRGEPFEWEVLAVS
ncbi:MAG: GreA/GreB family elongation factor [Deltaproteobacteria bacterium]|nr:GreA/GreB family elongation factor [Deltaproteobacteria bacterium]